MSILTPAQKAEMIAATASSAEALVSDLVYMRQLVESEATDQHDIRRFSAVLRRILIDDDLRIIAVPRIGRVSLVVPDETDYVREINAHGCDIFLLGPHRVAGDGFPFIAIDKPDGPKRTYPPLRMRYVNTDGFRSQNIIYTSNTWIRRVHVIKYVAFVCHGIHSEQHEEPFHFALQRLRLSLGFEVMTLPVDMQKRAGVKEAIGIVIDDPDRLPSLEQEAFLKLLPPGRNRIDVVLMQLLTAAQLIISSPDVIRLEEIIRSEIHEKQNSSFP